MVPRLCEFPCTAKESKDARSRNLGPIYSVTCAETIMIPKELWFRFLGHFGTFWRNWNQNGNQINRIRNQKGINFQFWSRFISQTAKGIIIHDSWFCGINPALICSPRQRRFRGALLSDNCEWTSVSRSLCVSKFAFSPRFASLCICGSADELIHLQCKRKGLSAKNTWNVDEDRGWGHFQSPFEAEHKPR